MGYNKVLLMGNVTRDIQIKYLPSNQTVIDLGLAVNRKFKRADGTPGEEVLFVDCTAFGRTAEVIHQYFKKGDPIFLEGRLKLDQWESKEGEKRSKIRVTVESFEFVGGKKGADDGAETPAPRSPQSRPAPPAEQVEEEPIPFAPDVPDTF